MSDQFKSWRDSLPFFSSKFFNDAQLEGVFADSKTLADALPVTNWRDPMEAYEHVDLTKFDFSEFIRTHFALPQDSDDNASAVSKDAKAHIEQMWVRLTRQPDETTTSSLIPLPFPYIVPGGRFREIYYWDTYFTALGLIESKKQSMVRAMVENFLHIQQEIGCIPNGNRTYYHTRSQPPVLALLVELLDLELTDELFPRAYQGLQREHAYWMDGASELQINQAHRRVVKMPCGALLNRYYDDQATPRPESYKEDIHAAQSLPPQKHAEFFRNLRAACESGWDFSSRWMQDPENLASIQTTSIVPVDLNALLYTLESVLADLADKKGEPDRQAYYRQCADARGKAINDYLWSEASGLYVDYNLLNKTRSNIESLAGTVALFAGLASKDQAKRIAERLERDFLRTGGLITTLTNSSQQWDAPNGWAPLQWFAVSGLRKYGYSTLANEIMQRWVHTVERYFAAHQVILEKYNVCEPETKAGGGEYDVQLGFGWTNGVTRKFYSLLESQN